MTKDHARDVHGSGAVEEESSDPSFFIGADRAIVGGVIAVLVVAAGQIAVGRIYSDYQARELIEAMVPSAHWVGTGVITASATILALMLTMLGLGHSAAQDLDHSFYDRVKMIARLSAISLTSGIILLLLLTIPIQESQNLPTRWYSTVYYVLVGCVAFVSGIMISIVLMLNNAVTNLITVLHPASPGGEQHETDEQEES